MSDEFLCGSYWDHVLQLLSSAAYEDAALYAERGIAQSPNIRDELICGIFERFPRCQPERSLAINHYRSILSAICKLCPVDDVVFGLIDASSENEDIDLFELTLFAFKLLLERESNEMFLDWCLSLIRVTVGKLCASAQLLNSDNFETLFKFIKFVLKLFSPLSDNLKCLLAATMLHFITFNFPHVLRAGAYSLLEIIVPDPFYLIKVANYRMSSGAKPKVFCHLLNTETVSTNSFALYFHYAWTSPFVSRPQLYLPSYVFLSSLSFVEELLNSDSSKESQRGMELINYVSSQCQGCLDLSYLTCYIRVILRKLNYFMVYNEDKKQREFALKTFETIIASFDIKAQYHLFLNFRHDVTHSGTLSLLISKIKTHFDSSKANHLGDQYFQGKRLLDILKLYCFLNPNEETDLVQNAEQIIAALNFFWYLLVLIRKADLKIEGLYPELKAAYLDPLNEIVKKSLSNCKEQLKELEDGNTECGLKITTQLNLPNLSKEEKIKSVICARNATELIQLTLNRVLEFWDET